ncbi:putative signal transduction histidine kinase [Clostridium sp. DL-VIII]|nr:putative signal transduction histidine kinase [Clostridium sp. DL-VIII]
MVLLLSLGIILTINDYIRTTKLVNNLNFTYYLSLFLTICGVMLIAYFINGIGISIYVFFSLVELLGIKAKKIKILILVHMLLFLTILILQLGVPNTVDKLSKLGISLLNYFAVASIAYSIKAVRREKEEVNKLNEELKHTNIRLHQYILEVEELTASKERNMMAQELHDSVGHSLMALTMHLEFARKICDAQPDKVKEVLIKSEEIAKSSISNLRKAVSLLKKEREITHFNDSIKEIINNFHMLNNIKINFKTIENIDKLSSATKNSMYLTVKEFITNSIKHGKATEININIIKETKNIKLVLSNNGMRCKEIRKSNGLIGIENRIASLNGLVEYFSDEITGFGINISIPIFMEEI